MKDNNFHLSINIKERIKASATQPLLLQFKDIGLNNLPVCLI